MFLEQKSFDSYLDFIAELIRTENDPILLQNLFLRPLFVTPNFLSFTKSVFYPLLKPFFTGIIKFDKELHVDKLRQDIITSISENISLCPNNILFFIKKFENKFNFLKEVIKFCFIDQLIEYPSLFQAIDPWLFFSEKNKEICELLRDTIDDGLIENIIKIFTSDPCFQSLRPFTFDGKFEFIQKSKIISNIDEFAVKKIYGIVDEEREIKEIIDDIINKNFEEYDVFLFKFEGEASKQSPKDEYKNVKYFDNEEKNVDRFDMTTLLLNTVFTKDMRPELAKSIPQMVAKVNFEKEERKFKLKAEKFIKNYQSTIGTFSSEIIFSQFYYSKIKFYDYLCYRQDLQVYDKIIFDFLLIGFDQVITEIFKIIDTSRSVIKPVFQSIVRNDLNQMKKYAVGLKEAFLENTDPLSKMMHIKSVVEETFSVFFSINLDKLSDEDFILAYMLIFAYANPPRFVSNLVFIYDFSYENNNNSKALDALYCELTTQYSVVLTQLFSFVKCGFNFTVLRSCMKKNEGRNDSSSQLEWRAGLKKVVIYTKILLNENINKSEFDFIKND